MLERAVQFEPEYFYSDQKYANYLLPKWGWPARRCSQIREGRGGPSGRRSKEDILYFELTRTVVRRGGGNESPKAMDWARVQRGYGALNAAYGETKKNDNELALLAYLFEDRDVAQKQFALGGRSLGAECLAGQEVLRPRARLVRRPGIAGPARGLRLPVAARTEVIRALYFDPWTCFETPWRYSYIAGEKKAGRARCTGGAGSLAG